MVMEIWLQDNEITQNTHLGGNIDPEKFRQCTLDAQLERTIELLGEKLYEKIDEDYANNTLAGDYLELFNDYIKPFLIREASVNYLIVGAFTVANNGIFLPLPQNSSPITDKQLEALINAMKIKSDMYAERLKRKLCKLSLAEYTCDSESIINPTKNTFGNLYYE